MLLKYLGVLALIVFIAYVFTACSDKPEVPPIGGIDPCQMGKPAFSGLCVTDSDDDFHHALSSVPKDRSDFKFKFTTPLGARVESTVDIPQDYKDAIDPAFQAEIARYKTKFDWQFYQEPKHVDVRVITCNFIGDQNPETIGAPLMSFAGTYAAGQTIGAFPNSPVKKMYIIVCQQDFALVEQGTQRVHVESDWKYPNLWANALRAELEHMMDRTNDQARFDYYQGPNEQHPQPLDVP